MPAGAPSGRACTQSGDRLKASTGRAGRSDFFQEHSLASQGYCIYTNIMRITFDPAKRANALAERGLDFADAEIVFQGVTLEVEDTRKEYGEVRIICYGYGMLAGRMVVIGYTPRGADRHVFSMRKANDREQARIAPLLEV
jgi:uncharacterized DUF497 family protein